MYIFQPMFSHTLFISKHMLFLLTFQVAISSEWYSGHWVTCTWAVMVWDCAFSWSFQYTYMVSHHFSTLFFPWRVLGYSWAVLYIEYWIVIDILMSFVLLPLFCWWSFYLSADLGCYLKSLFISHMLQHKAVQLQSVTIITKKKYQILTITGSIFPSIIFA